MLTIHFGMTGAAFGFALSSVLEPLAYLAVKWWSLPFSPRALASVMIRPLLAAIGMAIVVSRFDLAAAAASETIGGLIAPWRRPC